uniref:LIM zinc-binding domain-containing protein n=1 Tax=Ditylenchus dipsaci TaxID=166011 RepID=A0A915DFR9_9BILA
MKVKQLAQWTESFNIPATPWLQSDWQTVFNLLSRFLCKKLVDSAGSKEILENGEKIEAVELTFQEIMHLAESIGIPQFVVVCDSKQTIAENQMALFTTLCTIRYNMNGCDSKYYREIVFPFQLAFNMDVDDSSRYCAACSGQAHLMERSIVDGRVWHRKCMKCCLCKKQFAGVCGTPGQPVLFGDPMYRVEEKVMPQRVEKATPPPRPPPPKSSSGRPSVEEEDTMTISQKIESAIHHDISRSTPVKTSPEASEKNWEMLNYPVELNPFGSDEEEIASSGFEIDFDENTKNSSNNPFSDSDEVATESDLEEVENPVERVVSSFDNPSSPLSGAISSDVESSPRLPLKSVCAESRADVVVAATAVITLAHTTTEACSSSSSEKEDEHKGQRPKSQPPPPPKPPRFSQIGPDESAMMKSSDSLSTKKDGTLACGTTMTELNTQLRKLHCQLTQIETIGSRLESQIIRAITNGKLEWKKSKIVDEYVANVERKCEALRIESILVRKYMDLFINASHKELDKQMKQMEGKDCDQNGQHSDLTELLVQLMHMKNELLCIETSSATPSVNCKSLKKSDGSSILKKSVKQTLKSLKKKL